MLSYIQNFPLSSFIPFVNLVRLRIFELKPEDDGLPEIVVQSDIMPKIRKFETWRSSLLTKKLLHAKMRDGRPAFNLMDLRRLSVELEIFEDEQNLRYLLENSKSLEELFF